MSRAVESVRRAESQVHRGAAEAALIEQKEARERQRAFLVRNGVCVSLELAEKVQRAEAELPPKELFDGVAARLCGECGTSHS